MTTAPGGDRQFADILTEVAEAGLDAVEAAGACPRVARGADPGDEVIAAGLRAQHPVQRIIGELLLAQLAGNRARSTAYRRDVARFPVMKNLAEFDFSVARGSPPWIPGTTAPLPPVWVPIGC